MPGGVGIELIIVVALLVLLGVAFAVGRRVKVEPGRSSKPVKGPPARLGWRDEVARRWGEARGRLETLRKESERRREAARAKREAERVHEAGRWEQERQKREAEARKKEAEARKKEAERREEADRRRQEEEQRRKEQERLRQEEERRREEVERIDERRLEEERRREEKREGEEARRLEKERKLEEKRRAQEEAARLEEERGKEEEERRREEREREEARRHEMERIAEERRLETERFEEERRRREEEEEPVREAPRPAPPIAAGRPARPIRPKVGARLGSRFRALLVRGAPTTLEWRSLEEALVLADTGLRAARRVVERVREDWSPGADPEELLVREIASVFEEDPVLELADGLSVVMVVGVNGTGKTTTIGKLAYLLAQEGKSVALAASDTFRAAAIPQLAAWGRRAGAEVVAQERGADPGAVAFDAAQAALTRNLDVLIVDTAGRIHTRQPLMDELGKVRRSLEKSAGKVDETILVLDATTGQNGIVQAQVFREAVDITGIALTKIDGTARGGIVLAIREEFGVPVKLVGTGEGIQDLKPFDPVEFARGIVEG